MIPLQFERFDSRRHRRESFDCGVPLLTAFLKNVLNQQMKRGVTVGYVLAQPTGRIAGYVTLSAGEIPIGITPEGHGFPLMLPLPTSLIGRLAVDLEFRGRGLGGDLLVHAIRVAVATAEHVASSVIEVDALDASAVRFYEHFGFKRLKDDPRHLYLPMVTARELVDRVFSEPRP